MSPELDRLVAAAEGAYQDARLPNEVLSQRTTQAIVRAVLMALRELSDAVKKAAEEGTEFYGAGENIFYDAGETIARAVNFILDTNVCRAIALQDLADIDRDLL